MLNTFRLTVIAAIMVTLYFVVQHDGNSHKTHKKRQSHHHGNHAGTGEPSNPLHRRSTTAPSTSTIYNTCPSSFGLTSITISDTPTTSYTSSLVAALKGVPVTYFLSVANLQADNSLPGTIKSLVSDSNNSFGLFYSTPLTGQESSKDVVALLTPQLQYLQSILGFYPVKN